MAELITKMNDQTCSLQQLHSEWFPTCQTSASSHHRTCALHLPDAASPTSHHHPAHISRIHSVTWLTLAKISILLHIHDIWVLPFGCSLIGCQDYWALGHLGITVWSPYFVTSTLLKLLICLWKMMHKFPVIMPKNLMHNFWNLVIVVSWLSAETSGRQVSPCPNILAPKQWHPNVLLHPLLTMNKTAKHEYW